MENLADCSAARFERLNTICDIFWLHFFLTTLQMTIFVFQTKKKVYRWKCQVFYLCTNCLSRTLLLKDFPYSSQTFRTFFFNSVCRDIHDWKSTSLVLLWLWLYNDCLDMLRAFCVGKGTKPLKSINIKNLNNFGFYWSQDLVIL